MSGKRAISLFMAFNSQIIYKYIQVQMSSTALVLYLPMEIAIWQKLYDHMCKAFQDQGDEATFPLNISSYVRMSRWFPGEIQWASSLTFFAHSCYFLHTIFRLSRFHVAFDYNIQTILDPRSQREGSYKFGAVIVNVQSVSEWVSESIS